jgi:hypothetical protein
MMVCVGWVKKLSVREKERDMTTTTNCTDIRSALTPTSSLYHISAGKDKVVFIHLVETEQA